MSFFLIVSWILSVRLSLTTYQRSKGTSFRAKYERLLVLKLHSPMLFPYFVYLVLSFESVSWFGKQINWLVDRNIGQKLVNVLLFFAKVIAEVMFVFFTVPHRWKIAETIFFALHHFDRIRFLSTEVIARLTD